MIQGFFILHWFVRGIDMRSGVERIGFQIPQPVSGVWNPLRYVLTIGLSKILMYDKICKNYIHEKESVKYEDLR